MKIYKIYTTAGSTFGEVAKRAKLIAKLTRINVEFDFNSVKCLVNRKTDLACLFHDYSTALSAGCKTVGDK